MSQYKQQFIVEHALSHDGKITLDEACNIQEVNTYYTNGRFHVGEILSRMVKAGILKRVKRGSFEIDALNKRRKNIEFQNQPELF